MRANQFLETIAVGDNFDIELGSLIIESQVVGFMDDGVVIEADDKALAILGVSGALLEAEYQGRKVPLNKPMRGDVKKFKVYVKNKKGNVIKVNFGHGGTSAKRAGQKTMSIKKSDPARRRSFRARHRCDTAKDKTTARYWSCRKW